MLGYTEEEAIEPVWAAFVSLSQLKRGLQVSLEGEGGGNLMMFMIP